MNKTNINMDNSKELAKSIVKYFVYKAAMDGELITPLKMQKLLYYAYVWVLVKKKKRLFEESFEAWPKGPVLPSMYNELKKYGYGAIDLEFVGEDEFDENTFDRLRKNIPDEYIEILDTVYDEYAILTAIELVMMTHNEKPWKMARKGLEPVDPSNNKIDDKYIIEEYAQKGE